MRIALVTLFPEAVQAAAAIGVTGTALANGTATLSVHNPREACTDTHRTVDDRPFGGGPGMVMKPEPLAATVREVTAKLPNARTVLMSPQGQRFDQRLAEKVVREGRPLVLVAGRYEGVDERLLSGTIDEEWSVGDFVLSGGELAALVVVDTVVRLLPGVLGHPESAQQDSFSDGLLDHPHYTRPEEFEGQRVPPVLLSGDHARIARWRKQQALGRTLERRPELLEGRELNEDDKALLEAYINDRDSVTKT